jgi:hypothetical protein
MAPASTSRLRAAPGAPRVLVALAPTSRLGAALGLPCATRLQLLPQGSSGAVMCCLGFRTRLLAQGSSGAATCPVNGLYKLHAIKQNFPGDPAIMIFIRTRVRVSVKALRDKGCSARLQDMQQAVH